MKFYNTKPNPWDNEKAHQAKGQKPAQDDIGIPEHKQIAMGGMKPSGSAKIKKTSIK